MQIIIKSLVPTDPLCKVGNLAESNMQLLKFMWSRNNFKCVHLICFTFNTLSNFRAHVYIEGQAWVKRIEPRSGGKINPSSILSNKIWLDKVVQRHHITCRTKPTNNGGNERTLIKSNPPPPSEKID